MVVSDRIKNVKERHMPDTVKMVSREDWKALPPTGEMLPLKIPLNNVILTWTDTEPCELPEECERTIREVQKAHMDKGLPDIQYNYVIGGDRLVYVGRGLDHEPPRYPEDTIENAYIFNGKSIEIAFVGKHMSIPPVELINKAADLLAVQMLNDVVIKPVNMNGIKDNKKIVEFSELMEVHYKEYSRNMKYV